MNRRDLCLKLGDCIEVMKRIPSNSVHAVITDPPYGFEGGFMGKAWDRFSSPAEFQEFSRRWAVEAFRVLRPGGFVVSFCSTKMYHRMACGIEDAGFVPKDMISWLYSSGFPKSYDVAQAIEKLQTTGKSRRPDRDLGIGRRHGLSQSMGQVVSNTGGKVPLTTPDALAWAGHGTALGPAQEPIFIGQKPLAEKNYAANVLRHGAGTMNVDACRIAAALGDYDHAGNLEKRPMARTAYMAAVNKDLKVTQAPPNALGRFPKNVIHDGGPEVMAEFARYGVTKSAAHKGTGKKLDTQSVGWGFRSMPGGFNDAGTVARFFYCAKASRRERTHGGRVKNDHVTVKPVSLMEYLITMFCPAGGIVLDPFLGSGTTGVAAVNLGVRFYGIERDPTYAKTAGARIRCALADRALPVPAAVAGTLPSPAPTKAGRRQQVPGAAPTPVLAAPKRVRKSRAAA